MDKSAIIKFAGKDKARKEMIRRVALRAKRFGITPNLSGDPNVETVNGHILSQIEMQQRRALIEIIRHRGYDQVIEEVAYTWFNRFIALRFMEVNGYLPSHVRVFTNAGGEFKPQILDEAIHLKMDGLDTEKVLKLKNANKDEELYKYLLIVQCNALNTILPSMFQRINDYTELLFPDNLLRERSVVEQMVSTIPEEDWKDQVQIIGWLYQYYNAKLKDKVFADLKKNIKITKETIPAATQLFTPDWIVRYMVENSLGRLWQEGHPNETLKATWKYYLDEAPQEPDVEAKLAEIRKERADLSPEDIRVIDPCMGSGHILCVLFDTLIQIYEDYGYSAREAAVKIVEKNLWGLDIDERAAQLAYFAVMMKGRQYDEQFFDRNVQPHVYAINETNTLRLDYEAARKDITLPKEHLKTLDYLVNAFLDAKEYGSILQLEDHDYVGLKKAWLSTEAKGSKRTLWYETIAYEITQFINQAISLSQKYHVVVTNPPYRGIDDVGKQLQQYVQEYYPDSCKDLSTVFMEKCLSMLSHLGLVSMINIPVWMSLSAYVNLRKELLNSATVINLLDLGRGMFGPDYGSASFTLLKGCVPGYSGLYKKFYKRKAEVESEEAKHSKFFEKGLVYHVKQKLYTDLDENIFAYNCASALIRLRTYPKRISDYSTIFEGLKTRNKERFVRFWFEVHGEKWEKYAKGGAFRRWYGNTDYVVKWGGNGDEIRSFKKSSGSNFPHYFKPSITYTAMTMSGFSGRYIDDQLFGGGGGGITNCGKTEYLLGFVNSCVFDVLINTKKATVNFEVGQIGSVPLILSIPHEDKVIDLVKKCVSLSKVEWDSFELSWDFKEHPLITLSRNGDSDNLAISIEHTYDNWQILAEERFNTLKSNEEKLNSIFIDIYQMQEELTPEVDDKEVTVRKADLKRDIRSFISYAVGCMFGRYSLDQPGLAYAGGDWDAAKYKIFLPDNDNIIPICDDEYFTDDIVDRFIQFVETVYGKETLEENLQFIADALNGKGTAREVIRRYFLNNFFADHCNIYQKRPIYWLFDSGEMNGFKCLIYLYRYQPDILARIRTDYIHPQQSRYRSTLGDLDRRIAAAQKTSERVKLEKERAELQDQADELLDYEAQIHHLANQMIAIDLDDGVKVNYAKFQDVLAKVK